MHPRCIYMIKKRIALVGNPNVGKSTVFNALTGMRQHTGNWPGKTVEQAIGYFKTSVGEYEIVDLPGTYSLLSTSQEEEVTSNFILSNEYDMIIVVMDATSLNRTLLLGLQIASRCRSVVFVVNLMDEAKKLGIEVNTSVLERNTGIPIIGITATSKKEIANLKNFIDYYSNKENKLFNLKDNIELQYQLVQSLCSLAIKENKPRIYNKLDRWLVHPLGGPILLFLMIVVICYLTICLANYPSEILGNFFGVGGEYLREWLVISGVSSWWIGLLVDGIFLVLSFVVSVMFPPMVIFFILFTLLEEYGLLPRIAFCLDGYFEKCNGHGKQALCMCMGLGCNCVGVNGCRIMEDTRDKTIGIITNSFMPCNGRFPMIITIGSIFFIVDGINSMITSALLLSFCICVSVASIFLVTYILSIVLFHGKRGSFIIELPPYRVPHFYTIFTHSLFHKIGNILGRAVIVSSFAGAILYVISPYLVYFVQVLNPIGNGIGVDGSIVLAFILGAPANEIVMPILLMLYKGTSTISSFDLSMTKEILITNGWDVQRALCFVVLVLFHFPCITTLLTIYKETKSKKTLVLSILVPALYGVGVCILITLLTVFF